MHPWDFLKIPIEERMKGEADLALTTILLALALLIALIAIWPDHKVLKAVAIAWIVIP